MHRQRFLLIWYDCNINPYPNLSTLQKKREKKKKENKPSENTSDVDVWVKCTWYCAYLGRVSHESGANKARNGGVNKSLIFLAAQVEVNSSPSPKKVVDIQRTVIVLLEGRIEIKY